MARFKHKLENDVSAFRIVYPSANNSFESFRSFAIRCHAILYSCTAAKNSKVAEMPIIQKLLKLNLTWCTYTSFGKQLWFISIHGIHFQVGYAHSVEQKSIGLILRTSRSGSDVRYSCYHNSSRFTFPIFVYSWRFSVFSSLQSITPCIY